MMKKTTRKTILLGLCAATCLTAGMAFTACGNVVPFEKEEKLKGGNKRIRIETIFILAK